MVVFLAKLSSTFQAQIEYILSVFTLLMIQATKTDFFVSHFDHFLGEMISSALPA
jgi:hypothetical protein